MLDVSNTQKSIWSWKDSGLGKYFVFYSTTRAGRRILFRPLDSPRQWLHLNCFDDISQMELDLSMWPSGIGFEHVIKWNSIWMSHRILHLQMELDLNETSRITHMNQMRHMRIRQWSRWEWRWRTVKLMMDLMKLWISLWDWTRWEPTPSTSQPVNLSTLSTLSTPSTPSTPSTWE